MFFHEVCRGNLPLILLVKYVENFRFYPLSCEQAAEKSQLRK
jgi:hypothetical protein